MSPEEFINKYYPFAIENEKEMKTPALLTLAQAALESGWGRHAKGNNFFGIKAGKYWTGEVQEIQTKEFINGKMIVIKDKFRVYDNALSSFKDHSQFLIKRFPKAYEHTDAMKFIFSVQNDHKYKYATDPDYLIKISKIINIIKKFI